MCIKSARYYDGKTKNKNIQIMKSKTFSEFDEDYTIIRRKKREKNDRINGMSMMFIHVTRTRRK